MLASLIHLAIKASRDSFCFGFGNGIPIIPSEGGPALEREPPAGVGLTPHAVVEMMGLAPMYPSVTFAPHGQSITSPYMVEIYSTAYSIQYFSACGKIIFKLFYLFSEKC